MKKLIFVALLSAVSVCAKAQTTRYVTQTGAGNKSGLSWVNASDDLQLLV